MEIVTRAEAKAQGLKRYFTGKPCRRHHTVERFTASGSCRECLKITKNAHYDANKERITKERREYRAANKDKMRDADYQRNYGISLTQYDAMLAAQENQCAICRAHAGSLTKGLVVDHDHDHGNVRGLLCSNCNTALGLFDDRIWRLREAIRYLERHS